MHDCIWPTGRHQGLFPSEIWGDSGTYWPKMIFCGLASAQSAARLFYNNLSSKIESISPKKASQVHKVLLYFLAQFSLKIWVNFAKKKVLQVHKLLPDFLAQFSLKFWVNFTQKRPYKCTMCGRTFLSQFSLKFWVNFAKKKGLLTSVQSAAELFSTIFPQKSSQFRQKRPYKCTKCCWTFYHNFPSKFESISPKKKDLTSVQSAAGLFSNIFQHNNYVPLYRQ